jgi:hypothetical protein
VPEAKNKSPKKMKGSAERSLADEGHLASIERLLSATYDLMSREPNLDRGAFEHLRQLRVKVRFAMSARNPGTSEAPREAPVRWSERKTSELSPLEFLSQTYRPWLQAGTISRADIRHLDRPLYLALYKAKITSKQLDDIGLPTKEEMNNRQLAAAGPLKRPIHNLKMAELPPAERERARLWSAARRRKRDKSDIP